MPRAAGSSCQTAAPRWGDRVTGPDLAGALTTALVCYGELQRTLALHADVPAARLAPPAGDLAVQDDHGGWKARCHRRGGVGSGDVDDLAGLLVADHVLVEGLEQMDGA